MNKKLNVLHLVLNLDVGGLENGVINLVNGLNPDKFRSIIVCIKRSGELGKRISNPSVKIYEMKYYGGFDLKTPLRLAKIIRSEQIDVVHTRNLKAYYFGFMAAKFSGFRAIVHSEHGRDYPFSPKKMLMQRIFSWFTQALVALSEDLKQCLVKYVHISPAKVAVIVNGVDTARFDPSKESAIRQQLGLSKEAIVIGAVGRLVTVKNLPELLNAVTKTQKKYDDVHLLIIGDGPLKSELEQYAEHLDLPENFHFLGSRNDIPELFNSMDIYTLTSFNEGISNTLLEAMSSALPVVASAVGGNPEIVADFKTGLLYKSGDEDDLVEKISILIDEPEKRYQLGKNARKYVMENRSIHSMINNYQQLYQSVCKSQN